MERHGLVADPADVDVAFGRTIKAAHAQTRDTVAHEDDKAWWREIVAATLAELGTVDDFEQLFEELWVAFAGPECWRLYDGARETLQQLQERGYSLAILSNWDRRLRGLLASLNLTPYFEHVVISSEVGSEKPAMALFHHTEQLLATSGQAILHIGDSPRHDQAGAEAAGWQWLLVDHGAAQQTTNTLTCLPELLDWLPN